MRSFLYGRYDVLKGARGYEVFAADRNLSRDLIRKLTPCFSTEDPHFSMLQTLGEFYVYFPAGDEQWVFGVGNVEERGDYFYYMLHGVVLSEDERRTLGYNPFRLTSLLNPLVGDARVLPILPENALAQAASGAGLPQSLSGLGNDQDGMGAYAAGLILDRLLRLDRGEKSARLVYDYHPNIDSTVWHLVYELLPLSWRAQLSLATLDAFLNLPTHIQGSFQFRESVQGQVVHLPLQNPEPTPLGLFLADLTTRNGEDRQQRLQLLGALQKDASEQGLSADTYADHLVSITKALVRPSLRTMQRWQGIAAGRHLFAWKVHYLMQIWDRLAEETAYFPGLAKAMVTSIQTDYHRLQNDISTEEDQRLRGHLNRLILHVEGLQNRELIVLVLSSPRLAADFFPKVDDAMLVQALWRESLTQTMFESLLQNRLQWRPNWSEELDGLWSHPQMTQLSPRLLAQIFDLLIKWKTRFAIQQVIEKRFLHHPDDFSEFLGALKQLPQMLSRFVHMLGRMIVWKSMEESWRLCHLLQICLQVGPDKFRALAGRWIHHRSVEFMLPKLARDPVLATELVNLWEKEADDDVKRLRLLHFLRLMYPQMRPQQWPHPSIVAVLQSNALFECLVEG